MSWGIVQELQDEMKRMYDQRPHHRPYDKGYWKGRMEALKWQWNQNMKNLIHDEPFKLLEVRCGMSLCINNDRVGLCKLESIFIHPDHAKDNNKTKGFCECYEYRGSASRANNND